MGDNKFLQVPKINARPADLLLQSAETLLQVTELAREHQRDSEIRIFYNQLQFHCVRLRNSISDALRSSSHVDGQLVNRALFHLSSLVTESSLQHSSLSSADPITSRLQALNSYWGQVRKQNEEIRLGFVNRCLQHEYSTTRRLEISNVLEQCADALEGQHSRSSSREMRETVLIKIDSSEPSRAIWKTAQSLFDALVGCKGCPCHQRCTFGAKLELGTYRKPENPDTMASHPKIHRAKTSKAAKQRKTNDGLDLDMFVSMEQDWHEFRVHAIEDRAVRFAHADEEAEPVQLRNDPHGRERVEQLCKQIIKAQNQMFQRLLLRLASGHLFEMRFEKSDFGIDRTVTPISLSQSFRERPTLFTEKTKRILSLIMGYTILHLHGTSWLQEGIVSADIQFFQTVNRKTPLRPFLQVQLEEHASSSRTHTAEESIERDEGEDLDMDHRCIFLVDLAVVLIELHFVSSFKDLAKARDIVIVPRSRNRVYYIDVDQVFNGIFDRDGHIVSEGWRSHIPEDSALLEAIDNCLDVELWETEDGDSLDSESLKSRIYEKVVRPLEVYLSLGFSEIPLDNIDRYARSLDFGRWGQALDPQQGTYLQALATREIQLLKERALSSFIDDAQRFFSVPEDRTPQSSQTEQTRLALRPALTSEISCDYTMSRFYDDELANEADSGAETQKYLRWRSEYERVYNKFVGDRLSDRDNVRVKIAILDTGIDRDHYAFEAREDRIKGRYNYHNEAQRNIPDRHGHGTFTASLVLDYAPYADLYIIKITDKENVTPDARTVIKAINHAVDVWGVDIISMSFGWPSSDFDGQNALQTAIDRAFSKKVLMFAAASNSGGQLGRAYPASSPEVICAHSTDTYGNASKFSPTAEPHSINIGTVGEYIESAWPTLLCDDYEDDSRYLKTRSGTSYATPILAGIAAFLLQYARLHLPEEVALNLKRKDKMEALLKRCAERGPDYQPRDNYYYVELSLNKHNIFGQDVEGVNHEIMRALRT